MFKNYSRTFYMMFGAQTISNIGDQILLIGLPWIVYELTQSTLAMGTISAINAIPQIFLGLLVGALIDRYPRQRIMILACFLEILLIALIPTLHAINQLSIGSLYLISFFYSICTLVFLTSYRSVIPQLVDKDNLINANSLIQSSLTLIRIVGPLLAGFLMASIGMYYGLLLDSLTFVLLFLVLLVLRIPYTPPQGKRNNLTTDIKEGLQYILRTPQILKINLVALVINIGMSIGLAMMVFYLRDQMKFTIDEVGLVYSIGGVVAFLLTLSAPFVGKRFSSWHVILLSCSFSSIGLISIPFGVHWIDIGLLFGLVTGGGTLATIFINTIFQKDVPTHMLGRIFATSQMIARVSTPLALMIGGWFSESWLSIGMLIASGGVMVLLTCVWAVFSTKQSTTESEAM